jgi:hypothetical protein
LDAARVRNGWQALQKEAASGVAQVTAAASAANLRGNSAAGVPRFKPKRSRPKLGRRCDRPQANGTERPLGRPALADTVGQRAGAQR